MSETCIDRLSLGRMFIDPEPAKPIAPRDTVTARTVIAVVAKYYGFRAEQLTGPDRHRGVSLARHVAMFICRNKRIVQSYPELARALGRVDHTTAMSGCQKVARLCGTDEQVLVAVEKIQAELGF